MIFNVLFFMIYYSSLVENFNSSQTYPYCRSWMESESGSYEPTYEILKATLDKNCTLVYGDIVINKAYRKANGEEPDLRFLSTIKEVIGSIRIHNTNVSRIPLENLLVIHGKDVLKTEYKTARYALKLWLTEETKNVEKTVIDLRNLRSIVSGSVFISAGYCSNVALVDWNEIFEDPSQQDVQKKCLSNRNSFKCASNCPLRSGIKHCWGPTSLQCQKFSKCYKRKCDNRCFLTKDGEEECCNSQCLGGCLTTSSASCMACKSVLDDNNCKAECPQKLIFDRKKGHIVENVKYKSRFINVCVKKCPAGLVEEEGECKLHCTLKHYEKKGNQCVPCKNFCERLCALEDVFSALELRNEKLSLTSTKLMLLANCTVFKGPIILDSESFDRELTPELEIIKSAQELWQLKKLKVVYGAVNIILQKAQFQLFNLSFLANLQRIEKMELPHPYSFYLHATNVSYLGLENLQYINQDKTVVFDSNHQLCYFNPDIFKQYFKLNKVLYINNMNQMDCKRQHKICDDQCEPKSGCWGPGPTMCRKCRFMTLGDLCASGCKAVPGFYQEGMKCYRCHKECKFNCTGPSADQCIGGCRHYREGNNCVDKCSRTYYLDHNSFLCLPCNSQCHPRNLTKLPVCTGPSDRPEPGGCNKCQFIVIESYNRLRCKNKEISTDYFSRNKPNTKSNRYSNYTEKFTDIIVTYYRCHSLCSRCTFATNQRISTLDKGRRRYSLGCIQCRGYWLNNKCVRNCSSNSTYLFPDTSNTSLGNCGYCDGQCIGCKGGSNVKCNRCKNFKLYLPPNNTIFSCIHQCPESYKDVQIDSKTKEKICYYVVLSKSEVAIIVLAFLFLLILIIFAVISFKFCQAKKAKRRESKLKAYFSNANETDDMFGVKKPINYLPVIRVDDLKYSKENVIGEGAFGVVYKGTWTPNDNDFDDNVSMGSCRNQPIEVAIKAMNKSGDKIQFETEIRVMASVRHKHCLRLLGVCYQGDQTLLISSYLALGNMNNYLTVNKPKLTSSILLLWAEQIACGMSYLQHNHIIHRDLATRNVLIYEEDMVQITDFGLAKIITDCQIKIPKGIVPVRWLAIETFRDGIYSHKTDVWAYAVTLWEIFTFAEVPYKNIHSEKIRTEIIKGTRLRQPEICSIEIYLLMLRCWSVNPDDRPTFEYLRNEFKRFCMVPNSFLSYPNNDMRDSHYSSSRHQTSSSNGNDRRASYELQVHKSRPPEIDESLKHLLNEESAIWNKVYQPSSAFGNNRNHPHSPSIISQPISNSRSTSLSYQPTEYLEPRSDSNLNIN